MKTKTEQATGRPWQIAPSKGNLCAFRIDGQSKDLIAFIGQTGSNERDAANAALIVQAVNEWEALNAVAEAVKPFDRLKDSRSACADAYHIATDWTGKHSIGESLTSALATLSAIRNIQTPQ